MGYLFNCVNVPIYLNGGYIQIMTGTYSPWLLEILVPKKMKVYFVVVVFCFDLISS